MEVKIRNRSHLMRFLALLMFLTLVWAYAQLEWGAPQSARQKAVQARGSVVSADGRVLATSVDGKRVYPQGTLAGQLLGMMGATEGLEGLEHAYDGPLTAGRTLKLTIDTGIQAAAEAALARTIPEHQGEYGAAVVLETRTGRVLAAASYPPFDPGTWRTYSEGARRNRAFLDRFEPGSTVKALVVAAALNEGLTTPDTLYSTPMSRFVGGRWGSRIGDSVAHPKTLTTQGVLQYSSNVGMTHIVEHFPKERMRGYLEQYGFGRDIPLPTVVAASGQLQPLSRWSELVRATNAFGQGMSSTTLQLAAAFNVLANDGRYVSPRLVEGEAGQERRDVLRPEVARTTRTMLQTVVQRIAGNAGIKGYDLAGKTGTAQVVVDGRYSSSIYDSVFAGFFPVDSPRITIAVMVHGAKVKYHGSQLAAPIFRSISADVLSSWGVVPPTSGDNE
ncbi:peptidoglycan D,D-transpeptidase FtsI family protein [Deinococcus multiflagellatus]|uniref:Peptidoglycan D,D-transpeptidase FtsI family protein n=1 Tax=Deinococcus multiflagellatus TaxID=1656887 RepID=A0ABW1ZPH5_9DEIO|nr:penicillin-binding protein 2 [Deinococcus multiflagellatus]MBZ9715124.1 penicillin-binding protein 2 [Deinococcus multiflagellatus]